MGEIMAARDAQDHRLFVDITRVNKEERTVEGYATTESLDSFGTIIDLESVRACLPEFMRFPALREMHQPSAAGSVTAADPDSKGLYVVAKVVDDVAWNKVTENVYRGFSIGGGQDYTIRNGQNIGWTAKKDQRKGDKIALKRITEISLVDRPSNTDCTIDEYRIYEEANMAEEEVKAEVTATEPEETRTEMPDLKRYMGEEVWDAKCALNALSDIMYLLEKEKQESHPEAAGQAADLAVVVEKLKKFIVSEIQEGDEEKAGATIEMAAGAADDVERKGAAISKNNLERIQAMHDHSAAMGARCSGGADVKKAGGEGDDITRLATLEADVTRMADDITRLEGEKATLVAEVTRLAAMPSAPRGNLRSIGKSEDLMSDEKRLADEADVKRIAELPPEQQAVELVKRSQRKPEVIGFR